MSKQDNEMLYYDIGKATGYERAISDIIILFGEAMALSPENQDFTGELLGLIEPSLKANIKGGRLLDRA